MSHNLFRPLFITLILFYLPIKINATVIHDILSSADSYLNLPVKRQKVTMTL